MKKSVVLVVILLALGSLVFAQDAKKEPTLQSLQDQVNSLESNVGSIGFSMWGRTGYIIARGSSAAGSQVESGWVGNMNTWPPAPRENLNWWFTNDFLEMHFTMYLNGYFGVTSNQVGSMALVGVDAVLKLVPNMFTLHIGEYNADGWDTFRLTSPNPIRDLNNNNVGRFNGFGIIGDLAPKDSGFEAAVMWRTADPTTSFSGAIDTFANTANNTDFAASYTVPNTVKVTAGSTVGLSDLTNYSRNLFGRVQLLMVPNLTLWADVRYQGWAAATSESDIFTELAGSYTAGNLTAVWAGQFNSVSAAYAIRSLTGLDAYTQWIFQPEVYYNAGAVTPGIWAQFGGTSIANSGVYYMVEPYVKINDFNLRISFLYGGSSASGSTSYWEIPVLVDFSF